ncbi:hypothetical protein IEE_04303 [Bacillus cereus BAG5X1-1]|uniref:DUF4352 domain-containing protein n=1 Tax=Bacillus cereus BAG5X1-1 TaxID=1053189 RepID=J8ARL0_BACCE|nr:MULTISPECIES: hypothetical protein [Bacillus cereus group]EJQ42140.1 hypothetical protein IEE_04303 [Bacillus cereus BAG5X1-1]PGY12373.1 hypothetical protein COE23_17350 [Bacillus cereus]QWH41009.1 hypothetical protein EXW53_04685 [Bacillus mycoides]WJE27010.1 hypothetical protein QRE65_09040 [Bacillus cereus]
MLKKFTTCILGGALVFNLSGCGNTSDKTSSESKETNSKQEEKKVQTTDEAKTKENTKENTKQKNTEQTKEKSKIKEKEYAVNKDFHTPKFDVTVKRVVERDKVGKESIGFQKPEDGHVFIVVEAEGKNITNEPMKLAVLPSVDLVDENDNAYQSDVWAASSYGVEKGETSTITKELKPGEVRRESKVYVINKEKFDTGKWYVLVNHEYKEQIK